MLAVAMLATVAHAEFISGNELLQRLESSESYDRGLGMGYVAGVFDATSGLHHCSPSSVSLGQMRDMTLKALRAMPESLAAARPPVPPATGTGGRFRP